MSQSLSDKAIPNFVTVSSGPANLPLVTLRSTAGHEVVISCFGGHVLHWRNPAKEELLFVSSKADFSGQRAIRGGVPLAFPQFSNAGPLPAHGLVRTATWTLVETEARDSGSTVKAIFEVRSTADMQKLWPHDFELRMEVELSELLKQRLIVRNSGTTAFKFNNLFHTYFAVSDITHIGVKGLQGCAVVNQLTPGATTAPGPTELFIEAEHDSIYQNVPPKLILTDYKANRSVEIRSENLQDAVVWNPWVEKTTKLSDLEPLDFQKFVCIECGNVASAISLNPGATWHSQQILTAKYL